MKSSALSLGPARIFKLEQQEINAPVFLQHRDALQFRRMRGQHGADAQARYQLLDLGRADAILRSLAKHLAEGPAQLLATSLALDLPAPAHGGVLLGD